MDLENDSLTADEQAQFDQMRADDMVPAPAAAEPTEPAAEPPGDPNATAAEPAAGDDKRPQMVPHAALHEERERRKQIEKDLAAERHRMQVLEERTNLLLQRIGQPATPAQPAQPAAPAIPPIEQDPLGNIVGTIGELRQTVQQQQTALQQAQQQQQQAAALQQLQNHAMALEQNFRRETPDYDAAVAHLRTQREGELALAGFADPGQRQMILQQEALGLVARALQSGRNPAEDIYALAKFRGYAPAAATPPAASDAAPAASAADRLRQVSAGQQQSRSLGQVRGAGPAPMTAQRLLEMDDSEFDKAFKSSADVRELFGA